MRAFFAAPLIAALISGSAFAQTAASTTTPLNLKACSYKAGKADEDYGEWRCSGYAAIPIVIRGGDQRSYVSFGANARNEPAMKQTLASFNGEGKAIEWRGERSANGKVKPYATIMRWSTTVTQDDGKVARGQVLVVTRLSPGPVCHVGYVDAIDNLNGFALAQKIADESARNFDCSSDKPIVMGSKGPAFSGPYGN